MLLSWFTALLWISVNTGDVAVWRKPGENVTLECSSKSLSSVDGLEGMYLYHGLNPQKEVLYYHKSEKVTSRSRYLGRVKKNGTLLNHTITISNLVVNDTGIYRCGYKRNHSDNILSDVYILIISGEASCSRAKEEPLSHVEGESPPLVWVIVAACAVSIFGTIIFILLILKLKQVTRSRRRAVTVPNEYVYEVMTRNRSVPAAAPDSLSNPYGFT